MLLHALYTSPRNVEVELLVVAAMWEEDRSDVAVKEEAVMGAGMQGLAAVEG